MCVMITCVPSSTQKSLALSPILLHDVEDGIITNIDSVNASMFF
jgi:hypothetical protein